MDKNFNAKPVIKKPTMAVDKSKKPTNKKKKKSKKLLKCDQNSDYLEIEGVRALEGDQAENESDSSVTRATIPSASSRVTLPANDSPSPSIKSSNDGESVTTVQPQPEKNEDNDLPKPGTNQKPGSARKLSVDSTGSKVETLPIKHTQSASVLQVPEQVLKKATVSFSNLEDLQTIPSSVSNMSVKSKNTSQKGKTKSSSKGNSNGAPRREKTLRVDPQKSAINKAAENAARIRSEESLRWEFALDDEEQEMERIRIYKINRRKRYLAAAQEKGLGWVVNYGNNGSPIADDALSDIRESVHASVTDFSPVRSIINTSQRGTPMNIGGEIAC